MPVPPHTLGANTHKNAKLKRLTSARRSLQRLITHVGNLSPAVYRWLAMLWYEFAAILMTTSPLFVTGQRIAAMKHQGVNVEGWRVGGLEGWRVALVPVLPLNR
ncbi:MAG: hypothetical protein DYH15_10880 [Nitrosomonas sp. PRO4]|nr:hypothetical protein [Nitrosomonas sp. PRO4]